MKLSTLCKASVLFEYANFKYKQRLYKEAIEKYLELKQLLEREEPEETDFEALKAMNYYKICQTYLNLSNNDRVAINNLYHVNESILDDYLECIDMCKKLNLPDKSKVDKLLPKIQRAILNSNLYI